MAAENQTETTSFETIQINPRQLKGAGLVAGLGALFEGLSYGLRNNKVLAYVLAALVINGIIIGVLVWLGARGLDIIQEWIASPTDAADPSWLDSRRTEWPAVFSVLNVILEIVFWVGLLFVVPTVYSLLVSANPLSAFFVGKIFEIVFKEKAGRKLPENLKFFSGLKAVVNAEIGKLLLYAVLLIILFILSLVIPVIGSVIFTLCAAFLGMRFTGWGFVAPYYEGLGYGFKDQRVASRKQMFMILGLGSISLVPILNLLAVFVGPIGGALLTAKAHLKTVASLEASSAPA